jgi:hypothetical protein
MSGGQRKTSTTEMVTGAFLLLVVGGAVVNFFSGGDTGSQRPAEQRESAPRLSAVTCGRLDDEWEMARNASDLLQAAIEQAHSRGNSADKLVDAQGRQVDLMTDVLRRQDEGGCFD